MVYFSSQIPTSWELIPEIVEKKNNVIKVRSKIKFGGYKRYPKLFELIQSC